MGDPSSDVASEGWSFKIIDASDSDPRGIEAGYYLGAVTTGPGLNRLSRFVHDPPRRRLG
jgi:hypothetical protein